VPIVNIFLHHKIENKPTSTILILIKRLVGREHMADGSTVQKVDRSLVVTIVRIYVAKNSVAADQLGGLITTVHRTLSGLGTNAPPAEALTPAVPIRRSVQQDHVVCLECGFRSQTLRRHLRVRHSLDVAAYRARWQLSPDHPVTAPAYSERRSAMAKQFGLGRQSAASEAPPAPRRRGRPRRTSTSS
jgi:predicted transcriptional regulator